MRSDQMSKTTCQAFFFDAQAKGVGSFYGGEFDPALLSALVNTGSANSIYSRLLRGDVLVEMLCARVQSVSNDAHGQSSMYGYDMELYRTLIWDLADAFSEQWNTLDLESFPLVLARSRVHCVVLPTFPVDFRVSVDQKLRRTTGYLGCSEIDIGNPIQSTLCIEHLIDDAFIADGTVYLECGVDSIFVGSSDFAPGGEKRLVSRDFDNKKPPMPLIDGLSRRGKQSLERYEGKKVYTIQDRVIHALSRLHGLTKHFSFSSSSKSTDVLEADLPEAKFVRYLLNAEHKDGAGKAKFFKDVLAIKREDWRYLAAQFYEGLRGTELSRLEVKEWQDGLGASFNCTLDIKGMNGRIARVLTNWIMRPGSLPQLVTARPEEADVRIKEQLHEVNVVVPTEVCGTLRWEQLYALAHEAGEAAAEQCVPTPMKVVGYPVEMEGLCGFASIHIPDARKDFARWVVRSGVGRRHHKSGAIIFAFRRTQSIDKATAYARAFASVLKLNGVECTVESRLD